MICLFVLNSFKVYVNVIKVTIVLFETRKPIKRQESRQNATTRAVYTAYLYYVITQCVTRLRYIKILFVWFSIRKVWDWESIGGQGQNCMSPPLNPAHRNIECRTNLPPILYVYV